MKGKTTSPGRRKMTAVIKTSCHLSSLLLTPSLFVQAQKTVAKVVESLVLANNIPHILLFRSIRKNAEDFSPATIWAEFVRHIIFLTSRNSHFSINLLNPETTIT